MSEAPSDLEMATHLLTDEVSSQQTAKFHTWAGLSILFDARVPSEDPYGQALYETVLSIVGENRKGTAARARAIVRSGIDHTQYKSLYAAYNAAREALSK